MKKIMRQNQIWKWEYVYNLGSMGHTVMLKNEDNENLIITENKEIARYLEEYVYNGIRHQVSDKESLLIISLALLGLSSGLSWRQAASDAAGFLPEGDLRNSFAEIFAFGIVVTVGIDGLWIMLEVGKSISSKSKLEKLLTEKDWSTCEKITRTGFPFFFSFFQFFPISDACRSIGFASRMHYSFYDGTCR